MSFHDSPLAAAKERLSIPEVGAMMFPDWKPGKSCKSPFRDDRSASFSVYDGGRKWKDFGTGEGGDVADFLAAASGSSPEDGARRLIQMAGVLPPERTKSPRKSVRSHETEESERERKRATWPVFDCISDSEIESIAALRGLSPEGVRFAAWDGILHCADSREGRAWIITDRTRRNAQARRVDGKPWERIGAKAWTLPGAAASWPIGLPVLHPAFSCVALCEGGPDLLAAYDMARRLGLQDVVAPVAMLGASNRIPDEALRHLAGKRVRIFVHDDEAGEKAVARWGQQLIESGIEADGYLFEGLMQADGKPVKDLNDFMRMTPEQIEKHAPEAFAFAMGNPCTASIEKTITTPAPAQAAA